MEFEIKPIPGYPDYSVDDLGNVYSYKRSIPYIMKPLSNKLKYLRVGLFRNGKAKTLKIHRLVMLAFVGPCPTGHQVDHIDRDETNNALVNLRYVTPKENHANKETAKGEHHGRSKLTESQVLEIYKDIRFYKVIAEEYGVSTVAIGKIKNGVNWAWLTQ